MLRRVRRAVLPTIVVALLYCLFLSSFVVTDRRVEHVPNIGSVFLDYGEGSSDRIDAMRPFAFPGDGYDGQFALYIALDPLAAPSYIFQDTRYRLGRVGYPLTAAGLALGQPELVPWTLVLVNVGAAIAVTFLLGLHLLRSGASPVWALSVGAAPGLFLAVSLDTTEPLAYALVVAAWLAASRAKTVAAGALFGLAAATREVTLVFPLAWAAWLVVQRRYRQAFVLLGLSLAPIAIVHLTIIAWIGYEPLPRAALPTIVPFSGFHRSTDTIPLVVGVLVPSVVALALAFAPTRKATPAGIALVVNALVLVALLPGHSWFDYAAAGRITLGVLAAFCLYVPSIPERLRPLALVPVIGWMSPWVLDLPEGIP